MRLIHLIFGVVLALPSIVFANEIALETSLPIRLIRYGGTVVTGSASIDFAWSNQGECLQYMDDEWVRTAEEVCAPYVFAQLSDDNCYAFNGFGMRRKRVNSSQCAENYVSRDEKGQCVDHLFRPAFTVKVPTDINRCAGMF